MPRAVSGVFTLAPGNPVITGTTIESDWANATLADVAQEVTNSLDRTGKGGMLAAFKAFDGSVANPGITFSSEVGTGIARTAVGTLVLSVLGVAKLTATASGITLADLSLDGGLTVKGNTALGDASTDTLTVSGSAITWTNNPTHSGNHTFNGNVTVRGNTTVGDASTDTLVVNPTSVNWANNPTHSGNHTFSGNVQVGTPPDGYVTLSKGNGIDGGIIGFHAPGGARYGYIGGVETANKFVDFVPENAGVFRFVTTPPQSTVPAVATEDLVRLGEMNAAIAAAVSAALTTALDEVVPIGTILPRTGTTISPRFLPVDGKTIGPTGSAATSRANDDTQALYNKLWATSGVPIYDNGGNPTTRGASAAADWAAGKLIAVYPASQGGWFLRAWVASQTIDAGRVQGSFQNDDFRAHNHHTEAGSSEGDNTTTFTNGNGPNNPNVNTSTVGGDETRPYNISVPFDIRYK